MIYTPEPYQIFAKEHVLKHTGAGLFLDMGLGKTVITLTAVANLLLIDEKVNKVLVIAPLAVAKDNWEDEINKWEHLKHLRISKMLGSERERSEAYEIDADIYTINCENVPWLVSNYGRNLKFDWLVVDESSKFKNASSKRFKALRMVLPKFNRVTVLTGTPRPNTLIDLWSQLYLLDRGERLGKTLTEYRNNYFLPDKRNGHVVFSYKLRESNCSKAIHEKISDICTSMSAKDYSKLPSRIDRNIAISLSTDTLKKYKQFEHELVLGLVDKEITAANAAALSNKLLQFTGGAIYDNEQNWHEIHDEKIKALEDIAENANGSPILLFYSFRHEYERLAKKFKHLKPSNLKETGERRRWNEGKIQLAICHPKSMGHGLNLQAGGNIIVWFSPTWSLELYLQANARLIRTGQTKPVIVHHLLAKDTIDLDVMRSLELKDNGQQSLLKAVKARIEQYLNG